MISIADLFTTEEETGKSRRIAATNLLRLRERFSKAFTGLLINRFLDLSASPFLAVAFPALRGFG